MNNSGDSDEEVRSPQDDSFNPYNRDRLNRKNVEWSSYFDPWIYRHADGTPWVKVTRWDLLFTDDDDNLGEDKVYVPHRWIAEADYRRGFDLKPPRLVSMSYGTDRHWGYWLKGMPDGPRLIYNLHNIARRTGEPVWIMEGEKCADLAIKHKLLATTTINGAGNSTPEALEPLAGRNIYIVPDNDEAGHAHAEKLSWQLLHLRCRVKVVELDGLDEHEGFDDYIRKGGKV